jgi:hypothetical protein
MLILLILLDFFTKKKKNSFQDFVLQFLTVGPASTPHLRDRWLFFRVQVSHISIFTKKVSQSGVIFINSLRKVRVVKIKLNVNSS